MYNYVITFSKVIVMQIYTKQLDIMDHFEGLRPEIRQEDLLLIDIETTGLSPERAQVFLIGCVSRTADGWKLTQWLDDTGHGESEILTSFFAYCTGFPVLVTFGGDRFGLRFLRIRAQHCNLTQSAERALDEKESVDLARRLKPWRNLLALESSRQPAVEEFFGIERAESLTGEDIAKLYQQHLKAPHGDDCAPIMLHNEADLRGILQLHPILLLDQLKGAPLSAYKAQASSYTDHEGERREELLLFARAESLPENFLVRSAAASADGCYLTMQGNRITIKVPIMTGELKYFYANYKEYYYLPAEDQAMHKSIASFVEKSHRVPAKPDNCYTRKTSSYLPQWSIFRSPFFKKSYEDKDLWFEFTDALKQDREFFSQYTAYVMRHILNLPSGSSE